MAGLLNRADVADAGENVLKRTAIAGVIVNVVRRQQRNVMAAGNFMEFFEMRKVVWAVEAIGGQREAIAEGVMKICNLRFAICNFRRIGGNRREEAFVMVEQIF